MTAARCRDPINAAVGRRIRAARERHGFPQAEVARAIGISGAMLHHMEVGRSAVRPRHVLALADLLGLDRSEFEAPSAVAETADERAWLLTFRHLPKEERAALLAMVRP